MENIASSGATIIWLISAFVVWRFYHKLFQVTYLSLGRAIVKEGLISLFVGGIIAGLIVSHWKIAIVLVCIVIVITIIKKKGNDN